MKIIIILGSAPNAMEATQYDLSATQALVAINNAWKIRSDWTHLIHPEDFPGEKLPTELNDQRVVTFDEYVPANNRFGGIVYAGGTMAFTAGYWALDHFKPDLLLFSGCDMVYSNSGSATHFYGNGAADPLRADPTLQSLEAKSNRLLIACANENCLCANLSTLPESRLTFPSLNPNLLTQPLGAYYEAELSRLRENKKQAIVTSALEAEEKANCFVANGDYWNSPEAIDPSRLNQIDQLWLNTFKN